MNDIEEDLKRVIVETLALEDMVPGDIDSEAALFGSGLGLDSIDALELSIAIGRRYGVRIKADDERNREIFSSVRNLAAFIAAEGVAAPATGKVQEKVGA
jgi:acyl carrier protein